MQARFLKVGQPFEFVNQKSVKNGICLRVGVSGVYVLFDEMRPTQSHVKIGKENIPAKGPWKFKPTRHYISHNTEVIPTSDKLVHIEHDSNGYSIGEKPKEEKPQKVKKSNGTGKR